jgi:hypothetical protein
MGEQLPLYPILANRIRDPNAQESEKFQMMAKAREVL